MASLLHQLLQQSAAATPDHTALYYRDRQLSYAEVWRQITVFSTAVTHIGLQRGDRIATYLPKCPECVASLFGTSHAGGAFVPVNPVLKARQVAHILKDCGARILITSGERLKILAAALADCHELRAVILTNSTHSIGLPAELPEIHYWSEICTSGADTPHRQTIDTDMAAILYTSGSTGHPKGVVLSHLNMMTGARSVSQYLGNNHRDRLLAVLPFSFDYGLSQLTTAFLVGGSVVLMDYLQPLDVIRATVEYGVTGLAAVPPLWNQLAALDWPVEAAQSLRYITNSGGSMPRATTAKLSNSLPDTEIFLMYGLTEAFRSTYLPPSQVKIRPDSIGKAIPNAEVMVIREDGVECRPGETGELVHRGSLVALGYWNDPIGTAARFRPAPGQPQELPLTEIAVWSGDQVRLDEEGYLYFVTRKDEMIKTSGYRVSPNEIEDVVLSSGLVSEAVVLGVLHGELGQGILLIAQGVAGEQDESRLLAYCAKELPNYMVPHKLLFVERIPRNQNGKFDRKRLSEQYRHILLDAQNPQQGPLGVAGAESNG
ncbi:MAG: acyl-CoA ligase (AMP-forming), exosortase A system-associated [Gammaproteobacteria bacterium]|nr:acyl-CoA ligase (AMP-forming), exosortase A system-associated [Gammaproteobacteria bacterium]